MYVTRPLCDSKMNECDNMYDNFEDTGVHSHFEVWMYTHVLCMQMYPCFTLA